MAPLFPQLEQLELLPDVVIRPTIAMQRGESFVTQCSWCGLLVCADRKVKLGPCPACPDSRPAGYKQSWWEQEVPEAGGHICGPFWTVGDPPEADA